MIDIDLQPLVDLLRHDNPGIRAAAASALARSHDPRSLPILLEGLRDPDPRVRAQCALALSRWPDLREEHVERITELLLDRAYGVAEAAIAALRSLHPAILLHLAQKMWQKLQDAEEGDDTVDALRSRLIRTLGAARAPHGVPLLKAIYDSLPDSPLITKAEIIWAMAEIDSEQARAWILEQARNHTPVIAYPLADPAHQWMTMQLMRALARQGTREAMTILATWSLSGLHAGVPVRRWTMPTPGEYASYLVAVDDIFPFIEDLLDNHEMWTVMWAHRVCSFIPAPNGRYVAIIEESSSPEICFTPVRYVLLDPEKLKGEEDRKMYREHRILLALLEKARHFDEVLRRRDRVGDAVLTFSPEGDLTGALYMSDFMTPEEALALLQEAFGEGLYNVVPSPR